MPLPIASFTRLEEANGASVVVGKAVRKIRRGENGKEEAKAMGWLALVLYVFALHRSPRGPLALLIYSLGGLILVTNMSLLWVCSLTTISVILDYMHGGVPHDLRSNIFHMVFGSTYLLMRNPGFSQRQHRTSNSIIQMKLSK